VSDSRAGESLLSELAKIPERAPPLTAGTRLGPYEIRAPLGNGGMAQVYRAHDPRLGREVGRPQAAVYPLMLVPTGAGSPVVFTHDSIDHLYGRWLPDGKRVVFLGTAPAIARAFMCRRPTEASHAPSARRA
jgi:hypothetical protein